MRHFRILRFRASASSKTWWRIRAFLAVIGLPLRSSKNLPIHTLSNCSMAASTISGSSVKIPASKFFDEQSDQRSSGRLACPRTVYRLRMHCQQSFPTECKYDVLGRMWQVSFSLHLAYHLLPGTFHHRGYWRFLQLELVPSHDIINIAVPSLMLGFMMPDLHS